MTGTIFDCDTYNCPMYDGNHGCKRKTVQIRGGICREYLSQIGYETEVVELSELMEKLKPKVVKRPELGIFTDN